MKKLISLLVAIAMVACMATVAFAADSTDAGEYLVSAAADIPASVTLAAGEMAVYTIEGGSEAAQAIFGKFLYVSSEGQPGMYMFNQYWGSEMYEGNNWTVEVEMWEPWQNGYNIAIQNSGTETATYSLEFKAAPGTIGNPDTNFDAYGNNYPYMSENHEGEYHYSYTAGETAEVLTIKDVVVTYNVNNMENLNWNIMMTRDDNVEVSLYGEDGYADEVYMPLAAGQSVIITVRAQENEPSNSSPSVYFAASVAEATEVDMAGTYIIEEGVTESWYAVNGMLAGYIIVVNGDDASMIVDGTVIEAVDGVATAVLNGEGAVIPVGVFNAVDMIILPAPTEINAAGDYTADVAAGAEVEYAVNSMLAGAILTVEGEDAYIVIGTTVYNAVDGVATAVLDGTGATIAVKIGNAGEAAAQYALNIAYAPEVIGAAGDYTANVGAGAEVEYAVNSMLAGAILTVEGEDAYIVMGDVVVNAVDGVASVVLDGEGATIAVKIGNAGEAAAEYALNIAYAPESINAVGDYTANVPAKGEVEFVVNSKLDGAVVTVEGEGVYLIVNGVKVEGNTATLTADAATISLVVGNASDEAAQYTVNVAMPSGNASTGDFGIIASAVAVAISAIGGVAVVAKKKEF